MKNFMIRVILDFKNTKNGEVLSLVLFYSINLCKNKEECRSKIIIRFLPNLAIWYITVFNQIWLNGI